MDLAGVELSSFADPDPEFARGFLGDGNVATVFSENGRVGS